MELCCLRLGVAVRVHVGGSVSLLRSRRSIVRMCVPCTSSCADGCSYSVPRRNFFAMRRMKSALESFM